MNTEALQNVSVLQAAIGSRSGYGEIKNPEAESYAIQTKRSETATEMAILTVPQIVEKFAGSTLFIVKVDIEGFEVDLFRENTDWVSETKVVFIEPHDWMARGSFSSRYFQRVFSKLDFEVLVSGENLVYVQSTAVETSSKIPE